MELTVYEIVKKVITTSKSVELYQKQGKVTLEVVKSANKLVVRKAVEKIWDVKVGAVRIINTPEKKKIFSRREFVSQGIKKAIITLKPGYSIALPGHESMGAAVAEGK
jgi:large subunit ribosomal protein L23